MSTLNQRCSGPACVKKVRKEVMKYPSLGSLRVEARLRESGKTALESSSPPATRGYNGTISQSFLTPRCATTKASRILPLPKSWSKTVHHAVLSEHPSVTSRTAKTNPWYAFASRVHCNSSQPLGVSDSGQRLSLGSFRPRPPHEPREH
jgi:hypothetical protein